jgi:1-acyl-sn-glycerol-3-phosphate acyltransferase
MKGTTLSLLYTMTRILAVPIVRSLWPVQTSGLAHIPAEGAVILAANHLSVADHLFLPVACPRKVHFMAKAEYFRGRGPVGRLRASFLAAVGQIPVDRAGGRAALAGLELSRQVLAEGEVFGIFPEGTRSPDGRLYRGKTGVARLALLTGAPVIPVGITGTGAVQPIGTAWPRIGRRVAVRVGPPLTFARFAGVRPDRDVLREVTDEIMGRIAELSGQPVAAEPAPRVRPPA